MLSWNTSASKRADLNLIDLKRGVWETSFDSFIFDMAQERVATATLSSAMAKIKKGLQSSILTYVTLRFVAPYYQSFGTRGSFRDSYDGGSRLPFHRFESFVFRDS